MSQVASISSNAPASRAVRPDDTPILSDLLVYQDDSPAAENAFRYTEALAAACRSHIAGLMFGVFPSSAATSYIDTAVDVWAELRRESLEAAAKLWHTLKARFDKSSQGAELRRADVFAEETGGVLAKHARYADLVVLGWPHKDKRHLEEDLLEGSLFYSGRPILVVPEGWSIHGLPRSILVAWNGTREVARAVHDALHLLRRAETVTIVVVDDQRGSDNDDPGAAIALHLARYNVDVAVKQVASLGRSAPDTVLDEARFVGAELIIAGGYGHSRFNEWIFGGFTRDILNATTIPLLLSH